MKYILIGILLMSGGVGWCREWQVHNGTTNVILASWLDGQGGLNGYAVGSNTTVNLGGVMQGQLKIIHLGSNYSYSADSGIGPIESWVVRNEDFPGSYCARVIWEERSDGIYYVLWGMCLGGVVYGWQRAKSYVVSIIFGDLSMGGGE